MKKALSPLFYLFLILSFLTIQSCQSGRMRTNTTSDEISGKVISIVDGDTYDLLLNDNSTIRIRMAGIDAPEKGMPFYRVAKDYLGSLCFNKVVKVEITDIDAHGRKIAFSYLSDSIELSREMLKAGLAWHFKKYDSNPELAALENEARLNKTGVWSQPDTTPPWEIRKLRRQGISTTKK